LGLQQEVLAAQQKDEDLMRSMRFLCGSEEQLPNTPFFRFLRQNAAKFSVLDDHLFYGQAAVVPTSHIPIVLTAFHSTSTAGHFDADRTRKRLEHKFYWYRLPSDVTDFVSSCTTCRESKHGGGCTSTVGALPRPGPYEVVCVDIVGPLPACHSYRYILTMEDNFTKWAEAVPLTSISAEAVSAAFLKAWIYRFGPPVTIHSDRGTQFVSAIFGELAKIIGSRRSRTTPYHPSGNGAVERFHRSLMDRLRAADSPNNWVENLGPALFAYRTAFHRSINTTPFNLTFGFTPSIPADWPTTFASASPTSFVSSLRSYWHSLLAIEGHQGQCNQRVSVGDLVLVRRPNVAKMEKPWSPPARVQKILGPTVMDIEGHGPTHVNRLKLLKGGRNVGGVIDE
jgi:transposase InsO family protein